MLSITLYRRRVVSSIINVKLRFSDFPDVGMIAMILMFPKVDKNILMVHPF